MIGEHSSEDGADAYLGNIELHPMQVAYNFPGQFVLEELNGCLYTEQHKEWDPISPEAREVQQPLMKHMKIMSPNHFDQIPQKCAIEGLAIVEGQNHAVDRLALHMIT